MSNNIDFKELWNKQPTTAPDVKEIFARGALLQRKTRNKMLFGSIIPLTLTVVFISLVWVYYQPQMITTKLGLVLIIGAIAFFIMTSMGYLNLLFKDNMDNDAHEFLLHFLRIKQKQESMSTTTIRVYFVLLTTGITLYMIEYAKRGSLAFQLSAYGITFAWIAFNWFYVVPRMVKKQRDKMNAIIEKLEEVNGQLGSPES